MKTKQKQTKQSTECSFATKVTHISGYKSFKITRIWIKNHWNHKQIRLSLEPFKTQTTNSYPIGWCSKTPEATRPNHIKHTTQYPNVKSISPLIIVGYCRCSRRGSSSGNSRCAGHNTHRGGCHGAGLGWGCHRGCGKHLRKLLLQSSQVLSGDGWGPQTLHGVVGGEHGVVDGRVDAGRQHDTLR